MAGRHRQPKSGPPCGRIRRRTFLADVGNGLAGLARWVDALPRRCGPGATARDPGLERSRMGVREETRKPRA